MNSPDLKLAAPMLGPPSLVSVHDVMPKTLAAVEQVLDVLASLEVRPVTLLVVPGCDWSSADLDRLRMLVRRGHVLAAHGWQHRAKRISGLYHRLHALLLSRQVAEHLALDADGILALLRRSRDWFIEHDFQAPTLYVPPAWAMGAISRERLSAEGPFTCYEYFDGLYQASERIWQPTLLLGYEADIPARVPPLRLWNALNRARARSNLALRIGIHPYDLQYGLNADLHADLGRFRRFHGYPTPQA